jgi:alanyl aminopeptidase
MGNASALSVAGKISASNALSLVQTFASDPARQVVESSLDLALVPVSHEIPASLMPNYQRFLQKNFQARARQIGWTPKPGEDDNIRLLRPYLLRIVSTYGNDQELAAQAKELADKWLQDHSAVDPNLVTSVLFTAAFYGDKAFFDELAASLKDTKDRQERVIGAMRRFRDPASIQAGFEALLTGKIPFIEGAGLLFGGQTSDATRKMALEFLKAHYNEILAKRPTGGGFDFGSELPFVGRSYCDSALKAELKDFFEPRADKLLGARRTLNQVLEAIDVCIAETAEQTPSVEAFLKNY